MGEASTVTEAIDALRRDGFGADITLADGRFRCPSCGSWHAPSSLVLHEVYRFEGDSDPDDESIVLGVECPHCNVRGVIVSGYGPDADPAIVEIVRRS